MQDFLLFKFSLIEYYFLQLNLYKPIKSTLDKVHSFLQADSADKWLDFHSISTKIEDKVDACRSSKRRTSNMFLIIILLNIFPFSSHFFLFLISVWRIRYTELTFFFLRLP